MDRAISSLEQRLRTLQLNACIPSREAKSLQRTTWYAFHAWKAHPVSLRTLQLDACIPSKEAKSLQRTTWYAFRAWKAHPVCPSWHSKWLLKRGHVHDSKLKQA